MNRPDKGALYWDNLAVQIPTKKIGLLTRICDGQKRKRTLKKKQTTDVLFETQYYIKAHARGGPCLPPRPPPNFWKEKKKKKK